MRQRKKTIFVGLSGGVDSSVAAKRLIDSGYTVVGVFIKTWQPDFIVCNAEEERLDAMRVAAQLGIKFLTCDGEAAYKEGVADYMIYEYKAGRTPNPDVMCNKFVKFGIFLDFAKMHGATHVATGHYARVLQDGTRYSLYRGVDATKDQSYFLWTLSQEQLAHTLFPIGDTKKPQIRNEALQAELPTAHKSDSQGVCFLGNIDMKDFLSHYISVQQGNVLNTAGNIIGTHTGALFYTRGERHGFTVSTQDVASTPHYVIDKDIQKNTITVSTAPRTLNSQTIVLNDMNCIPESMPATCEAQFRYRQKPFRVALTCSAGGRGMLIVLDTNIEMPTPGQSCVFYDGDACLGGGIIHDIV